MEIKYLKLENGVPININIDYDSSIGELCLSSRVHNTLRRNNIKTVRDITSLARDELMRIPQIGDDAYKEITDRLTTFGFKLADKNLRNDTLVSQNKPELINIIDIPDEELSPRLKNMLMRNGYRTLGDVASSTRSALKQTYGAGRVAIKKYSSLLERYGLHLPKR